MSPCNGFQYLQRRLTSHGLGNYHDEKHDDLKRQFVYRYLQGDGTFMLRLVASNVSDYVCTKIIVELFQVFRHSLLTETIVRHSSLFKSSSNSRCHPQQDKLHKESDEHDDDDDDGSTSETIAPDIVPVPNPRQGRIFIERDALPKLPSDVELHDEQPNTTLGPSSSATVDKVRLRSSAIPLLKDIRRASEIDVDTSNRTTPHYKNIEFHLEPETIRSSILPPSATVNPSSSSSSSSSSSFSSSLAKTASSLPTAMKGPSPYATTYLTSRKSNEHELPYIDDSASSSSTSGRLTSTNVTRQPDKLTTALASTDLFFRRSHDV
jgi:hypothetical protein